MDFTTVRAEFDRVLQQIPKHAVQPRPVPHSHECRCSGRQTQVVIRAACLKFFNRCRCQRDQVYRRAAQFKVASGPEMRHIGDFAKGALNLSISRSADSRLRTTR